MIQIIVADVLHASAPSAVREPLAATATVSLSVLLYIAEAARPVLSIIPTVAISNAQISAITTTAEVASMIVLWTGECRPRGPGKVIAAKVIA